MLRAVRTGAKTICIGLGGSATNDGGAGMLQALGARVSMSAAAISLPGLRGLSRVASIGFGASASGIEWRACRGAFRCRESARGASRCTGGVWWAEGSATGDAEALRRYDGWMVGYGRLLDAAIAEARARSCCVFPRVHGHLARCSACPALVPPVVWVPHCCARRPSCARA